MKKHRRDYSRIRYDDIPKRIEDPERKFITGEVDVDHSVFKKTQHEKELLKILKAKNGKVKKKCRPGKQQRLRDAIAKYGEDCLLAKR